MNPYDILDVPPGADNGTIARALARGLKAKRHDAATLAEAQTALRDPARRLLADFCLPALPVPRRLSVPPEPPQPPPLPGWPDEDYTALAARLEAEIAADREAATQLSGEIPTPLGQEAR